MSDIPAIIVLSCNNPDEYQQIVARASGFFDGDMTVQVYLAINDVAKKVLDLLVAEITRPPPPPPKLTLAEKARAELTRIGESPEIIAWFEGVVNAFEQDVPAGPYSSSLVEFLSLILQGKNLSALTDDPAEWVIYPHGSDLGNVRQNTRNEDALSTDGGKTYYLLSDGPGTDNGPKLYTSAKSVFSFPSPTKGA